MSRTSTTARAVPPPRVQTPTGPQLHHRPGRQPDHTSPQPPTRIPTGTDSARDRSDPPPPRTPSGNPSARGRRAPENTSPNKDERHMQRTAIPPYRPPIRQTVSPGTGHYEYKSKRGQVQHATDPHPPLPAPNQGRRPRRGRTITSTSPTGASTGSGPIPPYRAHIGAYGLARNGPQRALVHSEQSASLDLSQKAEKR